MAIIGNLAIGTSVSTEGLSAGLSKASSKLNQFKKQSEGKTPSLFGGIESQFKGLEQGIGSLKAPFVALGGVIAAIGLAALAKGIVDLTSQGIQRIDDMNDSAAKLGMTVQDFSELSYGASFGGVKTEEMDASLNKLNVNMGEAINGSKTAQEAFGKLGITLDDIKGGDTGEVFKQAAEAISQLPTAAEQAAAAVDLFGKSGTKLLPFLQGGREGIAALATEAQALGVSVSNVDAVQVGQAADAIDRLKKIWEGLSNQLAIQLAPILQGIADMFVDAAKSGLNWGEVVRTAIDWIVAGLGFLLDVWEEIKIPVKYLFSLLLQGWEYQLTIITTITGALNKLYSWWMGKNSELLSAYGKVADVVSSARQSLDASIAADMVADTSVKPSEALTNWLDEVRDKSKQSAEAMVEQQKATKGVGEAMLAASVDAKKLIDKLQGQIETFGMTSEQAEVYKLKVAGAAPELIAQAEALSNQLKLLDEQKKKDDDLKNDAKKLFEETRTPLEKFNKQMDDLKEMWAKGLIDTSTFKRAEQKFKLELQGEWKAPQLLQQNTQAAESFLNQWKFGNKIDPQIAALDQLAEDNKQQLDVLWQINTGIRGLNKTEEVSI